MIDVEIISKSITDNIFILVTVINKVRIKNIYKPFNEAWNSTPIKVLKYRTIYGGDLNSHNTHGGMMTMTLTEIL